MRRGRIAGVAEQAEHLARLDLVAELGLEAPALEVGVKGISAVADVDDQHVAADIRQS